MAITLATTLDAVVRAEMARWTVPGIAIGILRENGEVEQRAWGIANLNTGERMRPESLCRIASISKVFTATLAMLLVDDGLIDLDEPVATYLPDLQLTEARTENVVTTRMLLTHRSGQLGDVFVDFGLGEDAMARAVATFGSLRQMYAPGELWAYTNSGFPVVGRVIEVVSGKPFDVAMRERVFEPLGMERTTFHTYDAIVHACAVGHDQVGPGADEHKVSPQYYPRNRFPAGGMISNAPDLLAFARFQLGDGTVNGTRVMRAETLAEMQSAQQPAACWADDWAIGWDIRWADSANGSRDTKVIAHGGTISGFKTQLTVVPNRKVALAILTNSGRGDAAIRGIERWLLERECGLRFPERKQVDVDAAALARVAGQYHAAGTDVTVSVAEPGLRIEMCGTWGPSGERLDYPVKNAVPIGELEFVVTDGEDEGDRFDFIMQSDGKSPRYLRMGGRLYDPVTS